MIPESIKQKVKKLDEAAKIRENSQKELLSFCRNKSYPLTDRWRIWENYCDKNDSEYILRRSDVKSQLLAYIIEIINDRDYDRHTEIDIDIFFDIVYDYFDENTYNEDLPHIKREILIDSILEDSKLDLDKMNEKTINILMEDLIQENFGSYKIDW